MLDPSSPDGSFYLEHVMKNGIDRIEVLKGTQSFYMEAMLLVELLIFSQKKVKKEIIATFILIQAPITRRVSLTH